MTLRGTLTDRRAGLIAERLRVLGQPLRVKLLDRLATQAITVQGLVGSLETTTERLAASRHPAKSRMVSRHKDGTRVRYELVDPHIDPLLERADSAPCAPPRPTHRTDQARPLAWADSGWSTEDIPARPELRARPLGGR